LISAKLGHFLDKPLAPIAKQIPVSPNFLTFTGFVVTTAAAMIIPFDPITGACLMLVGGAFDVFDGIVARTNGKNTKFGAFLDSTLDRYADAAIFLAIMWFFFRQNNFRGLFLTGGSLVGAFLISYVRARAESLGLDCNVGLIERPERIILLAVGCITGWIFPVMIVLFILSHITVIQRVVYVYKATKM